MCATYTQWSESIEIVLCVCLCRWYHKNDKQTKSFEEEKKTRLSSGMHQRFPNDGNENENEKK